MRLRIAFLAALIAAFVVAIAATAGGETAATPSGEPQQQKPRDKYPASCDGHPAKDHVRWAKEIVARGYAERRIPDKHPMKAKEKRALRKQKFCVQHDGLRARIADYREGQSDRYKRQLKAYHASTNDGWPSPESLGVSSATLAAIRECESGGNYATDTGNGFYGAYQFMWSTWASVGGSGNPAHASPAEQDYRAARLYASSGPGPWPVCGV